MPAAKSLADGKTRLIALPTAPVDKSAVTIDEIEAGEDISSNILFSTYDLGPTGSTTVDEKPLNVTGQIQVPDMSQFGGGVTVFRQMDTESGQPDATADATYAMFTPKGSTVYLVEIENGVKADPAIGDEYRYYEVVSDDSTKPDMSGYMKRRVQLMVQDHFLDGTVVVAPA